MRSTLSRTAISPAARRAFAPRKAIITSPGVTPLAASRVGSTATRICFGAPPVTNVSATSGTVRISSSRCAAISRSVLASTPAPCSVSARTGTSSIECALITGGIAPAGALSMAPANLACTLVTLRSWSSPTLKRTVTMA